MIRTPFARTEWVSPLERLYSLQRELDSTLENGNAHSDGAGWVPAMDVVETTDAVLCHLEVPGLWPEEIEVRVQDNMLVIAGEKKQSTEASEGRFRSIERRYGRFERTITLPRTVDTNGVKAHHENGVVTIALPKAEASKPRRIEIEGTSAPRSLNQ